MKALVFVSTCLLAVCNAFDQRRPAQDAPLRLTEEANKDPNQEVQFVNVQEEDGKILSPRMNLYTGSLLINLT